MSESSHDEANVRKRIETGRVLLRDRQPTAALCEFEEAYGISSIALADAPEDTDSAALHNFISAAYWRSAAFNKLRMSAEADAQTNHLLVLAIDRRVGLTAIEYGLIYYARGRYYLEIGALYDAISCFEDALGWNDTLERALRDRIQAYRNIDGYAALYYAMLAVQVLPDSFELHHVFTLSLLDAGLWGLAEYEARSLVADYPHRQPAALVRLAHALAGQGRVSEALGYCTRALELDDENQEALELMTPMAQPTQPSSAHETHDNVGDDGEPGIFEPEVHFFTQEQDNRATSIEMWLTEAFKHQNIQDYARALELFDLVAEADPDNIEAICGQVNCLRLTHKFLDAKVKAEGAIERKLADWRLYVELGRILHSQKDYPNALKWYDKADAEQRGHIEVGIARSNTLCAQDMAGAAGDLISELLKKNQQDFSLLEEQAWISFSRRDYGDAESAFRLLHEKANAAFALYGTEQRVAEMAKTSYGRGYVAMKQGNNLAALEHFHEARKRFDIVDYKLAYAWAQAQTDDPKALNEAKETCLALVRDTNSPIAHSCLGVIWFKLGFPFDAETHFKDAAQSAPGYACHVDLGALYAAQQDIEGAEREFREAIGLNPRDADAHYELGVLLLSTQDKDKLRVAEYEFKMTKTNDPYSVRAALGLSRCYRLQGRTADAERELRRAIKQFGQVRPDARQPDLWRLHVELAVLLIDRGNPTEDKRLYGMSYAEARTAIELAGKECEGHYIAAIAAERSGLFRAAKSHWRSFRELGGDQADVESMRIELKNSRLEARMRMIVPLIAGAFASCLFLFIVLDLSRLDNQPTEVLFVLFATFIATAMLAIFPNRLVKLSIAKVVTAELAAASEQSLPAGPTGQLPAASDRFDLPPRPFGQQLRRT